MDDQIGYIQQLNSAIGAASNARDIATSKTNELFREDMAKYHTIDEIKGAAIGVGTNMLTHGVGEFATKQGYGEAFKALTEGDVSKFVSQGAQAVADKTASFAAQLVPGDSAIAQAPAATGVVRNPAFDPESIDTIANVDADAAVGAAKSAGKKAGGALADLTADSTALDETPVGDVITAGLGLATVLASVFGHEQKPRHNVTPGPLLNPSTQFGV